MDFIRLLITPIEKQQCMIDEPLSASLRLNQLSRNNSCKAIRAMGVAKLGTVAKLSELLESQGKVKITVQQVVKPLTQANNSMRAARDAEELIDLPYQYHNIQKTQIPFADTH
jgi:hypothetical protein